jgi:hypothetical protein
VPDHLGTVSRFKDRSIFRHGQFSLSLYSRVIAFPFFLSHSNSRRGVLKAFFSTNHPAAAGMIPREDAWREEPKSNSKKPPADTNAQHGGSYRF